MKVSFALPDCGEEEIQEVTDVIKSGWLTTASRSARLEKDFAKFVGARHALAVNSATAALHLGLEALGVGDGDTVLVPTFTFTATAEVVRYLRAHPLFVDCDRETFCIDSNKILEALSGMSHLLRERLKAILPVHFGGHSCDMDGILEFTESNGIRVIEDAAHAFPAFCRCKAQGAGRIAFKGEKMRGEKDEKIRRRESEKVRRMIGTMGDVTCFSFYANKTMTTGEGGMLCTDDDEIAGRVKTMRLHGINRDVWDRFSTGASWEYDIVAPDLNTICRI